jgi:hypothetical protein
MRKAENRLLLPPSESAGEQQQTAATRIQRRCSCPGLHSLWWWRVQPKSQSLPLLRHCGCRFLRCGSHFRQVRAKPSVFFLRRCHLLHLSILAPFRFSQSTPPPHLTVGDACPRQFPTSPSASLHRESFQPSSVRFLNLMSEFLNLGSYQSSIPAHFLNSHNIQQDSPGVAHSLHDI